MSYIDLCWKEILQGRELVIQRWVIAVLNKASLGPFMHTVGFVMLFRELEDEQQQQQQQQRDQCSVDPLGWPSVG
jgi:hypothetical protein